MTNPRKPSPENGLRKALDVQLVENLLDVAELRGELRASLQALNEKVDRLLAMQEKVDANAQAIAKLKTVWTFVAAGIAFTVAVLKDWLFGQK